MVRKKTKEEHHLKFNGKHGDFYGYSKFLDDSFILGNNKQRIPIICPIHGVWNTTSILSHSRGAGCPICCVINRSENQKISNEECIIQFIEVHGDRYNYDKVDYKYSNEKVIITCKIHGDFEQSPSNHLSGVGCPKCAGKNKTTEQFIEEAKSFHYNKYNYDKVVYKKSSKKVIITCKIHGDFEQIAHAHLKGSNCPKCEGMYKTTEEFIEEAKAKHGNVCTYDKVSYKYAKEKVIITCKIHGDFEQSPQSHLNGASCPKCNNSKGELYVEELLKENNINFTNQKKFKGCKYKAQLLFDFYLPEQNICIEYDGRQHFETVDYFGGEEALKQQQIKDQIKSKFCEDNNIKLIRIRYDENIEEKLNFLILK